MKSIIVKSYPRDYELSAAYVAKATDIILNEISRDRATDVDRNPIDGESFSQVIAMLRDKGMQFPGKWSSQKDVLEALGFRIVKGRVRQWTKGGFTPGRVCDIVTL